MRITKTKVILAFFMSLLVFYLFNRCAFLFLQIPEEINAVSKLSRVSDVFMQEILERPFFISWQQPCVAAGFVGIVCVFIFLVYLSTRRTNYRYLDEHGSAAWGTPAEIKHFIDHKDPDNNKILSATEKMSMSGRMRNPEYERNKNVAVIGGSGSGKTRFFVKPNLLQMYGSYVITDPKGTLITEVGHALKSNGYEIKVLNVINFAKSMHYNPLAYIKDEKDILKVVHVLMENTKGEGEQSKEDFWTKAERLWFTAAISYLFYEAPLQDRNLPALSDLLDASQASESNEDFKSPVDIMFDDLEAKNPNHFAVKQYKKFKKAAGETLKSILISCAARIAPFDIDSVRKMMSYDEIMLDELGDRKTALFVIMSDTDKTFSFVIAMMMYQMFNLLCTKADDFYGGRLPYHVSCYFDEFANIGKIPGFEILISTIRSREISANIILQSMAQLTRVYKDDTDTILDCCDTLIFLGGKSVKTTEQISKMIGKTTIDNRNFNVTRGQNGNTSEQNQILARDLIDPSEVARLKRRQCLVLISGCNPFKSYKYRLEKHKRYKLLADYDESLTFDIQKIL